MPPAQKAYLQSVYDYSAWPTELRAQVAGVRYSFSSPQTRATEELLSAASKFYELHPELQTERVVGPEVPQGSTKVTAVYYDDEQRAVGIGIDQLDWQGEEVVLKASTIESVKGASAQLEVPGAVLGLQGELDYTFNVSNKSAFDFFKKAGCKVTEYSPECTRKEHLVLMKTKHCLRDFAGMCLKKHPDKKQLYLVDEFGAKYKLMFDCKSCVMKIVS